MATEHLLIASAEKLKEPHMAHGFFVGLFSVTKPLSVKESLTQVFATCKLGPN